MRIINSILSVSLMVLTGCAAIKEPVVPGFDSETNILSDPEAIRIGESIVSIGEREVKEHLIKESTIYEALKCQIARGYSEIEELKQVPPFNSIKLAQEFQIIKGQGTLSGKVQSVRSNGVAFNVVFPFGGFDRNDSDASPPGTNKPSIGYSSATTNVQEMKRTFDIGGSAAFQNSDLDLCSILESDEVDVGTFITDAIVSVFTGTLGVRSAGIDQPYGPRLTSTVSETTTSFTVVRKPEGGIALKVTPTAPRLNESELSGSLSSENTGVYTVSTKLPIRIGRNTFARRLHLCTTNDDGGRICIEEDFSPENLRRYQEALGTGTYTFDVSSSDDQLTIEAGTTRATRLALADAQAAFDRLSQLEDGDIAAISGADLGILSNPDPSRFQLNDAAAAQRALRNELERLSREIERLEAESENEIGSFPLEPQIDF